ncbi:MAG: hypothetical protein A2087_00235 [Spirochaetes bacterium GWD1_61_31]|nr:MAG: hypothetical protein A2Y37_00565 [Spirochaetes bacterium GWB1_60_80]OHD29456.1 MAG: hypothetical protein A2004_03610 [Spirochaetes bacterium GWC1_61_12]OHD38383.1 MAG: hypothetical protein A2087_00235 [Spirochaetes bacterium GWD1_61_31]OHD46212.1 MAG: hypothetical protein A2Y35_00960 [Spirochaetes bacterium GWE1_60_18]OHD60751.1 MAG: hypothetical protein A2Y32_07765 [Spirochaetes bacterium GWF1_60_12]
MIKALFFDLDNTLYPANASMEDEIVDRMAAYAGQLLGISPAKAMLRRRESLIQYGTTLEWLMSEHGFTAVEEFFATVHPAGEEANLPIDPALPAFLASLSLPKFIFTNAPREHAERILAKFQIEQHFSAIYDIRFNGLTGKPARSAVERVLKAAGYAASESLFVDDVPRYVQGFCACGGHGILIDHFDQYQREALPRIKTIYELARCLPAYDDASNGGKR